MHKVKNRKPIRIISCHENNKAGKLKLNEVKLSLSCLNWVIEDPSTDESESFSVRQMLPLPAD